jgi:hypothetical protein
LPVRRDLPAIAGRQGSASHAVRVGE